MNHRIALIKARVALIKGREPVAEQG
jgi:hypothetical protein